MKAFGFPAAPVLAIACAAALGGCGGTVETANGPLPQYCVYNNTATGGVSGAVVGAGAGAALGGGPLRSLVGAAVGGAAGALTGAQMDANCEQLALAQAVAMAEQQAAAHRAAEQKALADRQPPPPPVVFTPVDYRKPSNQSHHRIQVLSNYTDPATRRACFTYTDFSFTPEGKALTAPTGRTCKGQGGSLHA